MKNEKVYNFKYKNSIFYTAHSIWKSPKKRIQHCERSELRLHFEGTNFVKNAKNGQFGDFFENLKLAVKQCYPTGHF